jgi:hypothetical protein
LSDVSGLFAQENCVIEIKDDARISPEQRRFVLEFALQQVAIQENGIKAFGRMDIPAPPKPAT